MHFDLWESASGLQSSEFDRAIGQGLEIHIMEETADRQRLAFTHALVRDVLYEGVIPTRRRMWHRQVAEALVAMSSADPALVAHHFQEAGDERAIRGTCVPDPSAQHLRPLVRPSTLSMAAEMLDGDDGRLHELGWLRYEAGRFSITPESRAQSST